jgi:acyl-CoA thioester hydrolase
MMKEPPAALDEAVILDWPVGWGDMDSFSHLNNTVYFRYFEHVRIAYFERCSMLTSMELTGVGPILASTSCRFRRPITFPDRVWLGARVIDMGDDRFIMKYRLFSEKLGVMAAEGEGKIVMLHYESGAKAPIAPELRKAIEGLESRCFE